MRDSDFKNRNASFQFLQIPGLRNFIAKFPALKETSKFFFFVLRCKYDLTFCWLKSLINAILRVLLHINLVALMHIMFTSKNNA